MIGVVGLSFAYALPVIQDLSLALPSPGVTALLGPNGCGKTTLLLLLLGWLRPARGAVTINGKPVGAFRRRDLARLVGFVPQEEHAAFDYTAAEYVLLGRSPHLPPLASPSARDCTAALGALAAVGLKDHALSPVNRLSGGERQLVLFARSIAQEARVLLLDEPTSHLDPANERLVTRIIKRLCAEGATIVFSTHSPTLALRLADYAVLMGRDHRVTAGPLERVVTESGLSSTYGVPIRIIGRDGDLAAVW